MERRRHPRYYRKSTIRHNRSLAVHARLLRNSAQHRHTMTIGATKVLNGRRWRRQMEHRHKENVKIKTSNKNNKTKKLSCTLAGNQTDQTVSQQVSAMCNNLSRAIKLKAINDCSDSDDYERSTLAVSQWDDYLLIGGKWRTTMMQKRRFFSVWAAF